ncbi:zinc-dependent metalloprotease [Rhodohalobacter mucosus]|nr:zinc-dependent metalloprotease [Rhodohalobacter mucosus]
MKYRKLLFLMAALILAPAALTAQDSESSDDDNAYAKMIEGAEVSEGFFTFYQKDGKLLMAVSEDQLDSDFLLNYQIARGIGSSGLYGGTMLNIFEAELVALRKQNDRIMLVNKPHRYNAEAGTPQARAVDLTYGESILETAKVEATNEDGMMLIDVHSWFVGDLSNISQRIQFALSSRPGQPGRASLDRDRSFVEMVESFPENSNVQAMLTFRNQERSAPRTVPDSRFVPVSIFYSIAKLPEEPMKPRMADDRLGYFMTVHKDFTETQEEFFQRFVNRWRLECDGPRDAEGLCEPKEPIVYYLENTIPERYRQPMMEGVEAWGDAFEEAGFKNAIRAEMLPDSASAGDIRYATLRWNVSDQPGYGAIGPSVVDPRTGEILDADMLYEANMFLGQVNTFRNFVEPQEAINEIYNVTAEELELMKMGVKTESFFTEMGTQTNLVRTALMANGLLEAGAPMPDEFVDQATRWVTMHEVGHTLGLRHNFRSSTDTPVNRLHDTSFTGPRGVFSSVMDYPSPNIAPNGEENGHFYNTGVGSYDRWVISYGYTPDDDDAEEIARRAAEPGHAYGSDEDARGSAAIDPNVNVFSLSADPLAWGRQRADLIRGMLPVLPDIALEDDMPYYEVTDLFSSAFFQYARALAPSVKYIGGQYQHRDHIGDPNGRMPFEPVPLEKQREALNTIVDYAFAENAIRLPQDVYQKFGANRWSHWGNSNTYSGRIDFPLHQTLLGVQSSLLSQLFNPVRLQRVRDTEVKFGAENTVTIPELMDTVTEAIWSEAWNSPGSNIGSNRRDLQRAHLDAVIGLVTDAPNGTPADARSVARLVLQDLHERLERRLAPPAFDFDTYTRAHLVESKERIERALEAGLSLEN